MPGSSTSIIALIMTASSIVATSVVVAISAAPISDFDDHGRLVVVGVGSD